MCIGLISDIHGNLPALEKVMEKLTSCDYIYCAGDVVGYYPYPDEVIEIFIKEEIPSVMGNHDYAVITDDFFGFNYSAILAGKWTLKVLSDKSFDWLETLPLKIETEYFNIYHGMPADDFKAFTEYIFPDDPSIPDMLKSENKSIVVGHTHIQFLEEYSSFMFINPGSVGQPRDGKPGAAFAIFKPENMKVKFYRVKYNIDEVCEAIEKVNLPYDLCSRLYEGY